MGTCGSSWNTGPSLYYNWVSNGDGTWRSFSSNYPPYEWGKDLKAHDFDNDGDIDVYFNSVENNLSYWMKNINGKGFERRSAPVSIEKENIVQDMNDDGYLDIISTNYSETGMKVGDIPFFKNNINIAYGDGNWSWNIGQTFTVLLAGKIEKYFITDIDRDGDQDFIVNYRYNDGTNSSNGISCVFNDGPVSEKPSFVKIIRSPHVRAGSVHPIEWMANTRDNESLIDFDLSISYTGEKGRYHILQEGIPRFHTNLIIPVIPSPNVYLKLEWNGTNVTSGPFTIHSKDDRKLLLEPIFPVKGDYLIGGEEMEIEIDVSKYFHTTRVSFTLNHDNGSIDLGSHYVFPDTIRYISWSVPDGITELNCSLQMDFQWDGSLISYDFRDVFGIVPGNLVPRSINISRLIYPRDVNTTVQLTAFTNEGVNITDLCSYRVKHTSDPIDSYVLKNGSIKLRCFELGEYMIRVFAKRYGYEISAPIFIHVKKDLNYFTMSSDMDTYHVSETFKVEVTPYNSHYEVYNITSEPIYFYTNLNANIDSSNISSVMIEPLEPGDLVLTVYADLGLGNVSTNISFEILSYFGKAELVAGASELYEGETAIVAVDVERYDLGSLDEVDIIWNVTGPAGVETIGDNRIEIIATGPGVIDIFCNVSAYSEIVSLHHRILSLAFMNRIVLDNDTFVMEISDSRFVNLTVLDSTGEVFNGAYSVSLEVDDPSIVTADVNNGSIELIASSEGITGINVSVVMGERSISTSMSVDVVRIPRRLEVGYIRFVKKGESISIPVSVYDILNHEMNDFDYTVTYNNADAEYSDGTINITGIDIGPASINFTVSGYGPDIWEIMEFDVIHDAKFISLSVDNISFYPGDVETVSISLVDSDGNSISSVRWTFEDIGIVEVSMVEGVVKITANEIGHYPMEITAQYYNDIFTTSINIIVLVPQILSRIELVQNDDGVVRVFAYDQEGVDITDLCAIGWIGNTEPVTIDSVKGTGEITVKVTFKGKTLEDTIEVQDDSDPGSFNFILFLIPVVIAVILLVIAFLIARSRRDTGMEE